MLVARVVNGIGTGALNTIVPAWASEVADHTSRGKFIAIEFTLNIFGVVVAYWLGYGVKFIDNGHSAFQWRFPIGFQIIPLLVLFGTCWLFPESPRWLCRVDRHDEALFILQRLRGTSGPDEGKAHDELADIKRVVELERETSHGNTYLHMLFGIGSGKLHIGRRVQLCIWLQILQNWVGISAVTIYGPTIFSIAGYSSSKSQWLSGLNNIFYTISTLICVFTLDRIGRRRTLFWGSIGQAIAMFLAGGFCNLAINASAEDNESALSRFGAAATAMVYIFTFIFGATWLTVPWIYPAETFPLQVRAKGTAWGVVGWSLGNGTLTVGLPYMISAIDEKVLYIFGACNVMSIPISFWSLYPESAQRTLEDMDMLFASDSPWVWDAEETFALLKKQDIGNHKIREDIMLKDMNTSHFEDASGGLQSSSRQFADAFA
ncbi:general substrate transporter, partial [Aureobasidium melanogenum]